MKWALVCGVLLAGIWLVTSALPVMADGDSVGITATMPLSVYSVSSSAIGATSATITWTTNGNASSQVFYDTVSHTNLTDYAFQTAIDNTLVLTHSQSLGSLNASTTYYFRVVSTATVSGSAVQSVSNEGTFTTLAALNISAVTAGSITSSTATITWTTNNPADSQVFYDTASHGSSNDYAYSTPVNNSTVLNHNQNLSTLTVNTTYYYRVRSTATISGNNFVTVSAEYTFKTTAASGGGGGGGGGIGGGGGGSTGTAGVTIVTPYVDSHGVFSQNINAWSDDTNAVMNIPTGTTALTAAGAPITQISFIHDATPPAFAAGAGMIDQAYDITPNGITFSPAVTLKFTYYNLPAGMDPGSLQICYYDTTKNAWVIVPSTVDTTTNTISAQISHLTVYAITYGVKPVTAAPATTTTATVATTTAVIPIITTTTTTVATATTTSTPITSTTTTTTTTTTATPPSAIFNVKNLTVSPAEVKSGQQISVTVIVQNSGSVPGVCTVELKIDNLAADSKIVNLAAQTQDTINFTVSNAEIGAHTIDINGLEGKFTVVPAQTATTQTPVKKSYLPIIIPFGIGLFILALLTTIIIGLRRNP